MSTVVYSNTQPEAIQYMPLPDSSYADVWLRTNIKETTTTEVTEDGETEQTLWQADEVYFRTTLSLEEVTAQFDALFEEAPSLTETEEDSVVVSVPGTQDRLDAIEEAIAELAELIAGEEE